MVAVALRNRGEVLLADDAGHRHRHARIAARFEREFNVLQAQFQRKRGVRGLLDDHAPVVLVGRGVHRRAGDSVEERFGIHTGLARERKRLTKAFDDRCENIVARDLHDIGVVRLGADHEMLSPKRGQDRFAVFDRALLAGNDDIELPLCGRVRPPEHRRRKIPAAAFSMQRREPLAHCETHGRHVEVDNRGRHAFGEPRRDPHRIDRGVVGEHRDHDLRIQRRFRLRRDPRASRPEGFGRASTPVVNDECVARIEQPPRHLATHPAQSDESKVHLLRLP